MMMSANYFSATWTEVAAGIGNHLWQSTVFAAIGGMVTLVLRGNRARVRYWVWLTASAKFLIPFSVLVGLGSHLAWSRGSAAAGAGDGFYFGMDEMSRPFTQHAMPMISRGSTAPAASLAGLMHLLPAIVVGVWACGFAAVIFAWAVRWRRVAAAIRTAKPLPDGREVRALRRLENVAGVRTRIEMLVSPSTSLEPGIFGIVRPKLIWPEAISKHLDDAQTEAILAHEVEHVRRRDNLGAAMHMLVEAIFWFHPLVWWIGARLVEERERACDEEALRMGSTPRVYAESILKTCEFCVESGLACVSGVTGADLKKRIVRIMSKRGASRLGLGRKILLVAIGVVAVAGPVAFGVANAPKIRAQSDLTAPAAMPSFEVASVKVDHSGTNLGRLGGYRAENVTLKFLIEFAYNLKTDDLLSGGPAWLDSERFDIEAKPNDAKAQELSKLPPEQRIAQVRLMFQSLLVDRFKLKVEHQTRELPIFRLVVAKGGPKLTVSTAPPPDFNHPPGPPTPGAPQPSGSVRMAMGNFSAVGVPMKFFADALSRQPEMGGRVVEDGTGLDGKYDFTLQWTPENVPPGGPAAGDEPPADASSSGTSIFTALQDQLGLRLESTKGPVDTIVIDHVEQPTEN